MLPILLNAQENKPEFGIKFSDFIKNDFFYDSRLSATSREGHFLLYPLNVQLDNNGKDINAQPNFNFISIQTRLTGKITGPDAFGGKTSGIVEADFFGNENAAFVDANGFRLRHAVVRINWTNTELITGQYWNPLFQLECFPGVISFNTGAPIQPFSRNPQIRLTQKFGNFKIAAILISQRDFTSPNGSSSIRNSAIPGSFITFSYENKNDEAKKAFVAGLTGGYQILKPLLYTSKGANSFVTNEMVKGFSSEFFIKVQNSKFTTKFQAVYGQNLFDVTMLGGYAVANIIDTSKNTVSYTPLNTASAWFEMHSNGEKIQYGLWVGYTQNLGSFEDIAFYSNKVSGTDVTIRGADIQSVYRFSPRVVFKSGKLNFAFECEYTMVKYATKDQNGVLSRNSKGVITGTSDIANIRGLFAVIYNF